MGERTIISDKAGKRNVFLNRVTPLEGNKNAMSAKQAIIEKIKSRIFCGFTEKIKKRQFYCIYQKKPPPLFAAPIPLSVYSELNNGR
jgi:hypothetical protein